MDDSIIARIEKDLVAKRFEYLMTLPAPLRLQLKRIEDKVFELWKFDSVFIGQIRIDCFNACTHSNLTLDQLENIINNEGEKLVKYSFEKALKIIVRKANKIDGKVSISKIKKLFNGSISRIKVKV